MLDVIDVIYKFIALPSNQMLVLFCHLYALGLRDFFDALGIVIAETFAKGLIIQFCILVQDLILGSNE